MEYFAHFISRNCTVLSSKVQNLLFSLKRRKLSALLSIGNLTDILTDTLTDILADIWSAFKPMIISVEQRHNHSIVGNIKNRLLVKALISLKNPSDARGIIFNIISFIKGVNKDVIPFGHYPHFNIFQRQTIRQASG